MSESRESDDTVEIPAFIEAAADDDGPPCGAPEAVTRIWVGYMLDGMRHIEYGMYCCARHVPSDAQHLPRGVELADVVIQDGICQTSVMADGTTTVLVNLDYMIGHPETFRPTWPNSRNAVELGDFVIP
jgi:hypothetical protein